MCCSNLNIGACNPNQLLYNPQGWVGKTWPAGLDLFGRGQRLTKFRVRFLFRIKYCWCFQGFSKIRSADLDKCATIRYQNVGVPHNLSSKPLVSPDISCWSSHLPKYVCPDPFQTRAISQCYMHLCLDVIVLCVCIYIYVYIYIPRVSIYIYICL